MSQIQLTGRLVDPLGSPITGASLYFVSKATTRGVESVPKFSEATLSTDALGFYSGDVRGGWYKIYQQDPGWLAPKQLGVATVSGSGAYDIGTLIDNSVPPPTRLESISDVSVTGRVDGSTIEWSAATQTWEAARHRASSTLYSNITPVSHASAVGDLMSQSIPANTLATNGDRLRINGVFTTTTGDRRIRAYLGSALLYDVLLTDSNFNANLSTWNSTTTGHGNDPRPALNLTAEITVTRSGASVQMVSTRTDIDDYSFRAFHLAPAFTGIAVNLANANTFKFTASGEAANRITQREMYMEYLPAP